MELPSGIMKGLKRHESDAQNSIKTAASETAHSVTSHKILSFVVARSCASGLLSGELTNSFSPSLPASIANGIPQGDSVFQGNGVPGACFVVAAVQSLTLFEQQTGPLTYVRRHGRDASAHTARCTNCNVRLQIGTEAGVEKLISCALEHRPMGHRALYTLLVCLRTKLSVAAAQSSELRLMTYNIRTGSKWAHIDGKDFANKRTWQDRKRSVAKTIEIAGAKVVATQEGLDWQLRELRELLGSWWHSVGAGRIGDGSDDDEHAAILFDSRSVELLLTHDFWLSETPEVSSKSWGASLPRVATCAVFRFGELKFGVLNVHLDHSSLEARTQSAKLIRDLDKQPQIFFIAGDFNAPKDEPWYSELLLNDQLVDAWTQAETRSCGSCGQSTYHAWKGSAAPSTQWIEPIEGQRSREIALSGTRHIDCVFVSRAAISRGRITRARVITDDRRRAQYGGPFASDHYPVCVHYALHDAEAHPESEPVPDEIPDL